MGRIAEALKKAERERLARTGDTGAGGIATIAPLLPDHAGITDRPPGGDSEPTESGPVTITEGMSE